MYTNVRRDFESTNLQVYALQSFLCGVIGQGREYYKPVDVSTLVLILAAVLI